MNMNIAVVASTMVLLAGCATDIPVPRGHAPSDQTKLRATHHWDIVASDIAEQTRLALDKAPSGARIYVQPSPNPSRFESALNDFITTRLVKVGVPVATRPEGTLQVRYGTQLVTHVSDRSTVTVPLVAIAAGVMAAYNVIQHANQDFQALAVLGGAVGFDAATGRLERPGIPSKTELIVTTSLSDGQSYLMRKTDIYYIEDADLSLFLTPPVYVPIPTRVYRIEGARQ